MNVLSEENDEKLNSLYDLKPNRVYLDTAAATPVAPDVFSAMEPYFLQFYGNPSSVHQEGQKARSAVEVSRLQVANCLQVRHELVTFTSGGTESNNLAIMGYVKSLCVTGRDYKDMHILSIDIEHPSTLKTLDELKLLGVQVEFIEVDEFGSIDIEDLYSKLKPETILITISHINSEIGVVQQTQKISRKIRLYTKNNNLHVKPLLHVDAAQSPLWQSVHVSKLGADLVSLDASKFYGPKGVGALVANQSQPITRGIIFGGSQENNLRPGTESVPHIVGFAKALLNAQGKYHERSLCVSKLRDDLIEDLTRIPNVVVNGPLGENRVANNVNISIPGFDTEFTSIVLDKAGFAVSTKSACSTSDSISSNVVYGITGNLERAKSTLRFTLHEKVLKEDIQRLVVVLNGHVQKMKSFF